MAVKMGCIRVAKHARQNIAALGELNKGTLLMSDNVNHPPHYTQHPSGVECITITEHMTFNCGNAVKYIWRAGLKTDAVEDLQKAAWYINREIQRIKNRDA